MSTVTIRETFTIDSVLTDVTSVTLNNSGGTAGVIRNDTSAVVVAAGTAVPKVSTGVYEYTFTEPAGETGLTYTYWVEWEYGGETFRDEKTVAGNTGTLDTSRSTQKYLEWIEDHFLPLQLATPQATIEHCLENAIRYWNTHSGHKIARMYDLPSANTFVKIQVDADMKTAVRVLPSQQRDNFLKNNPMWSLLGIMPLGSMTQDLIQLSTAYQDYQVYLGRDFRWWFEKSDDPEVGGYLHMRHFPSVASKVYVEGTKRITKTEDIVDEYIEEWILMYTLALVKMVEGNTLRKSGIIDVKNDGQELVNEGKEEKKDLQEKLKQDARWTALIRRF